MIDSYVYQSDGGTAPLLRTVDTSLWAEIQATSLRDLSFHKPHWSLQLNLHRRQYILYYHAEVRNYLVVPMNDNLYGPLYYQQSDKGSCSDQTLRHFALLLLQSIFL